MDKVDYIFARQQYMDVALAEIAVIVAEIGSPDQCDRVAKALQRMHDLNKELLER